MLNKKNKGDFYSVETGQLIHGGIPKKPGLFLQVFDNEGNFLAAGQMIGFTKRPAILTLTRRECDVNSLAYRLFRLSDTLYIDVPLSEIGAVQLEPGCRIEEDGILYFKGKIREFPVRKVTWSPDRCVPLQMVKKLFGSERHTDGN
ncbi:hypothetical protein [Aneurinibacillus thermoaerophilus]|uniref:hypothetical protein n=1 Tax=Aneurinibacillus thermoaerophilus TaxID=143495 RepID=UPI002E1C71C9|nr:hypothetical protein [Aneurinibacillus thermoaerophilus]